MSAGPGPGVQIVRQPFPASLSHRLPCWPDSPSRASSGPWGLPWGPQYFEPSNYWLVQDEAPEFNFLSHTPFLPRR